MKLLAVETATEACSAALSIDGEVVEEFVVQPRQHSRLILPMIDRLMADAQLHPTQLDGLAFGAGPGAFTGVRIATGVIQGIAFGADLPVVPVSTLAAMSQQALDDFTHYDWVLSSIDARLGEVYWGIYHRHDQHGVELIGDEVVVDAAHVRCPDIEGVGVGSGWSVYKEPLMQRLEGKVLAVYDDYLPRAGVVAKLAVADFARAEPVEKVRPVYLRNNVAKKSLKP